MFPLRHGHQEILIMFQIPLSSPFSKGELMGIKIWMRRIRRDLNISPIMVKPIDRLVPVCSIPYGTYTSGLSTSSSTRGLIPISLSGGIPHLGEGFPLRCFQRLSLPNIATQRCDWRHNWNTIGSSIPVLSYWGQLPSSILRPRQIGTKLSHDVLNPARVPL